MTAAVVRANYDQLAKVASNFAQQAEQSRTMLQQIRRAQDTLQGGDWLGQGAQSFYAEMNGQVLPTLTRLVRALESASQTTLQVSQIMKAAEDEAARHLRAEGRGAPAGAGGPAGASGAPAGGNGSGGFAGAGATVTGSVLKASPFATALKPMSPLALLGKLENEIGQTNNFLANPGVIAHIAQHAGRNGPLVGFFKSPVVDKFGNIMAGWGVAKNSGKLLIDVFDGNGMKLESVQSGADLVANAAYFAGSYGRAFSLGYSAGQWIDSKLGLSTKIADALVDKSETWSSRTLVHEYVHKHGSAAEQAAYKQYRADFMAQTAAAARAGQPLPTFRPPDLPVLKKLDPAALRMAATNKDINSVAYTLALTNKSKTMPPFIRDKFLK